MKLLLSHFFKRAIAEHNFQSYAANIDDLNNKIQTGTDLMEEIGRKFEAILNRLEKLIEKSLEKYVKLDEVDSNDLENLHTYNINKFSKLKEVNAYDQLKLSCIISIFIKINFFSDIKEINLMLSQNSITHVKSTMSLTDLLTLFACKIRFIEFIIHALHAGNGVKTIMNIKDNCCHLSSINLDAFIKHRFAKNNKLHIKAKFVLLGNNGLLEEAATVMLDKEISKYAKYKISKAKGEFYSKSIGDDFKERDIAEILASLSLKDTSDCSAQARRFNR